MNTCILFMVTLIATAAAEQAIELLNEGPGKLTPVPLLNDTAQQSSTLTAEAGRALNDVTNGVFADGSCTQTDAELNPWWSVRFASRSLVHAVRITNRADCGSERLDMFTVKVDDQDCAVSVSTFIGTKLIYCTSPLFGKSVKISMKKTKPNILSLCDVTVLTFNYPSFATSPGRLLNVIPETAHQSSTSVGASASRAVNAITDGQWKSAGCSSTLSQPNSWWRVHLRSTALVDGLDIMNRKDCCPERLDKFSIKVGGYVCASQVPTFSGGKRVLCKTPVIGNTVTIYQPHKEYLTLCDVKVFGRYIH